MADMAVAKGRDPAAWFDLLPDWCRVETQQLRVPRPFSKPSGWAAPDGKLWAVRSRERLEEGERVGQRIQAVVSHWFL